MLNKCPNKGYLEVTVGLEWGDYQDEESDK
jgi:hypothetical protein